MKNIYCHKCGTIVGQAQGSLKVKIGTAHICKSCQGGKLDMPDFMRKFFGGMV